MGERGAELNVLLIEDSETDTALIVRQLRRSGFEPRWERVDSPQALRDALERQRWQLVVSDSSVPRLGVLDALALTQQIQPDVPFIAVSGTMTAEVAIDAMRAGAADFVAKDDLSRLGAAVVRELGPSGAERLGPTSIARRLLAAQEEERRRLARALHDQFGQLLGALRRTIEEAERAKGKESKRKLADAMALLDQAILEVRDFYVVLWPTILEDLGLPVALQWLAERHARSAGVAIDIDLEQVDRLPAVVESACFRIVEEALSNSARHADARRVEVRLRAVSSGVEVTVRDDGRGFDTEKALCEARAGLSLGLLAMPERASRAGGGFELESSPGRGTTVRARFKWGEP